MSEDDGARLVVFCGTTALRIDKTPWRLTAFYSSLYHDFDFDGDDY